MKRPLTRLPALPNLPIWQMIQPRRVHLFSQSYSLIGAGWACGKFARLNSASIKRGWVMIKEIRPNRMATEPDIPPAKTMTGNRGARRIITAQIGAVMRRNSQSRKLLRRLSQYRPHPRWRCSLPRCRNCIRQKRESKRAWRRIRYASISCFGTCA